MDDIDIYLTDEETEIIGSSLKKLSMNFLEAAIVRLEIKDDPILDIYPSYVRDMLLEDAAISVFAAKATMKMSKALLKEKWEEA